MITTHSWLDDRTSGQFRILAGLIDPDELHIECVFSHPVRNHYFRKVVDEVIADGTENIDGSNIENLGDSMGPKCECLPICMFNTLSLPIHQDNTDPQWSIWILEVDHGVES